MAIHADDQDEHDAYPEEYKDHLMKAFVHAAGHGPHPGKYQGPPIEGVPPEEPTETDLAVQRMREQGPALPPQEPPPLPAQETLSQPPQGQGQGKGAAAPHGTTPTQIGAQAVKPEEPEGNF